MKIVSTGSTISSPEFYEKRKKAKKRRNVIFFILFLLTMSGLIGLTYIRKFRFTEVEVSGNKVISSDAVVSAAEEILHQKYFYLVPKDNILLYPRSGLKDNLAQKFPRFSSITFSKPSLQTLSIAVTEREPFALYCGTATSPVNSSVCYFLDDTGYIFDVSPSFSEGVYFVYAQEKDAPENPLRTSYLTSEKFAALKEFIKNIQTLGLVGESLTYDDENYKIGLKNGGVMTWKRSSSLDQVYANLDAFLNEKSIKSDKTFFVRIQELDFGTENKVFFKLRPEEK